MANKVRSKSKLPNKAKQKRWRKGQSCVTNPESNKHRSAAKSRFFNVNTGPSSLTIEAVSKHEEAMSSDIYQDLDAMTIGGRSVNSAASWATNFTNCTNMSFNKILQRYSSSNLAAHKEVLAVLAASTEIIKQQGGSESDTEYFALLMSTLNSDSLQDDESLVATAYLLSIIIKRVPVAVLKTRFSDTAKVLLSILQNKCETATQSLVKSVIFCLTQLLRVQDIGRWNNEEVKHVFFTVLSLITFSKAKIRKAAHQAVVAVLRFSSFMSGDGAPACHPAAQQTATFCVTKLKEFRVNSNTASTMQILEVVKDVLHVFPKNGMKSTCELILEFSNSSDVILRGVALKTLHSLFLLQPQESSLDAESNSKIIMVLYESKPNDQDAQAMQLWLHTVAQGLINLARLNAQLCISHLARFVQTNLKYLQAVGLSAKSAVVSLSKLIKTPSVKEEMVKLTDKGIITKIMKSLENGLSYQYLSVWEPVLLLISDFIEVLGRDCPEVFKKCLKSLADMRDSPGFQLRDLLDKVFGMAFRMMGPQAVLEAVPLQITAERGESLSRSWMLPIMASSVEEARLSFFCNYFLPLSTKIEKLCAENQNDVVLVKTYKVLENQIWCLLEGFCTKPKDLVETFPSFAKTFGLAIRERVEVRQELLSALRRLVTHAVTLEKEKAIMSRYAPNFLPILFNLYVPGKDDEKKPASTLAVLETIKVYFKVCDSAHIVEYAKKCHERLNSEGLTAAQSHTLLDLVICLVPYVEEDNLNKFINMALQGIENADKTVQKKSYRILEEVFSGKSETSRSVVLSHIESIQQHLVKNLSTSGPSSKAPRLRCLYHMVQQMDKASEEFIVAVIPEVVLCTKATGEKARQAAFNLLSEIARSYMRWNPNTPIKDVLQQYFMKLFAGLAGNNPNLNTCTVLALTKIMFDFKDNVSFDLVVALVDSAVILTSSNSREVVQAALGLVKALMSAFGDTVFAQFVNKVVVAISGMKDSMRHHFRMKIRNLFSRLIRRYGFDLIIKYIPEDQRKLVNYIHKLQEREKRKKNQKEEEEESDSDEEEHKLKPQRYTDRSDKPRDDLIDEILQDSDSDLDGDGETNGKQKSEANKKKKKEKGAWLKEDEEIIDFMDSSVVTKVITTKPEQKAAVSSSSHQVQHSFKTAPDGRLIITETEEEKTKKSKKKDSNLDELFDSFEGKTQKRKRNDSDNEDESVPMKYKAGGGGIHRPLSGGDDIGKEYRSKKAKGDVKKGSVDPYAYVPLKFNSLNKRKRAKSTGQFKNLVKSARKGATSGEKSRKRKTK